jgi:hypothetical protein
MHEASGISATYSRVPRLPRRIGKNQNLVACSAISAARDGDHATHRQLISQARAVRAEAERAHEEAAIRIERVMNAGQGRGMWEIDLHGLHAPEVLSSRSCLRLCSNSV